jgi:hypothetical protein
MSIKVLVNSTPKNRVSINNQQRENIRTVGIGGGSGASYLANLLDVDATNPDNNETLVYDASSGKYVIKELPVVNGGTF